MNGKEPTSGQVYSFRGGQASRLPRRHLVVWLQLSRVTLGYSRLMGMDEEGTHARVRRHQREIIEPAIAEHHGRLVKYTGDGFYGDLDSPVEAVRCAIVIQQSMLVRNAAKPHDQRILYRIGVNLGDVIVEPDDVIVIRVKRREKDTLRRESQIPAMFLSLVAFIDHQKQACLRISSFR